MKLLPFLFSLFFTKRLLKKLPYNRFGDAIFHFINFVKIHKRLPTSKMLFNDVIYRIKVSGEIRSHLRCLVSDKETVKDYISSFPSFDKYNVPTLGVIRKVEDVDSYEFPENCCIKATHGSGATILRKNNEKLNLQEIKNWFLIRHYKGGREANYKNLEPKVIIEPILFGDYNLNDYKFFCYKGKAKLIQVDVDRHISHKRSFFDISWNLQDYGLLYPKSDKAIPRPENLEEMIAVAEKLASNFSFIRIDFYSNGKECYVGEITNCHGNGLEKFIPLSAEIVASKTIFE